MKLETTKHGLPSLARSFCTLIFGTGIGMLLAVAVISEDNRKVFDFHYYVIAGLLVWGSGVLRSMVGLLRPKKPEKELVDQKRAD